MNLKNMFNRLRKPKKISFEVFSKSLQDKLIELGYKKYGADNYTTHFRLFYYNKKEHIVPEYYDYFYIEHYYENIGFANNIENNPCGCWHGFSKEYFTKQHLQALFDRVEEYAKFYKQCRIQVKLDELNKDFE